MKTKRNLIQIWLLCAAVFLQAVTCGAQPVTKVAAGSDHSLFLKSDGSLWAMGDNEYGELGDGTYNQTNRPEQIVGSGVTAVAAGLYHSLFLKSDGSLWAMGLNNNGQLGDGTYTRTNRPEQIVASGVTAIAAGWYHSLFLKSDGSLWAMGFNADGELGDGTYYQTLRPEQIVASGVTAIAAGELHSLFLKSDGSLWAMGGNNWGQLGDGTYNQTNRPEQIVASGVTAIAAGGYHSLFLKNDGSLWAMGDNNSGQLGDGTYYQTLRPEQIVASGVTAIAVGAWHSLFLKSDGSLWAMGWNPYGELGDGTYNTTNRPEQIVGSGVTAIAAGVVYSLFVKSDGNLWVMGYNAYGELGDGTYNNTNRPELIVPPSTLPASGAAYIWTTFAGLAAEGSADGVGNAAQFCLPVGVAADTNGNVYVADSDNYTIRKVTPAGVVSTIAGFAGSRGYFDGANSAARFEDPFGMAVDSAGNLYVTDLGENTIRKLTPAGTNWVVSTIAGLAGAGIKGSADGTGTNAQFYYPAGVAMDSAGNLYVSDSYNDTIRKLTPVGTNWVVSTIAGLATNAGSADGLGSAARFNEPEAIAVDSDTNLYVADSYNNTIRKLTPAGTNWMVNTIAGLAGTNGFTDGTGTNAQFHTPFGIAVDSATNLYVADEGNNEIRKMTLVGTNWVVTTWAGVVGIYGSADGTGTNAQFKGPQGIVVDSADNVYVADTRNQTIRKITPAGVVSTLAGSIGSASSADGEGSYARFYGPSGVAADSSGNLYVADNVNDTIRKVTSAGLVSTMAGLAGRFGSADGPGSYARFNYPYCVAVDSARNVYVADTSNHTIRKVTPAGVVSTLAGLAGQPGSNDGTNSVARFYKPGGVTVDSAGNVYVADTYNDTIREVSPVGTNWVVTTLAGLATNGGSADGVGSYARFNYPYGVAVDSATNLYVADDLNFTIRKITPVGTNWVVSTIAGLATNAGSADGLGSAARFNEPEAIAVDSDTNLYVADTYNDNIREVTPVGTNWVVSTIGGLALSSGSADGAGKAARFDYLCGIAVDSAGNIYVADTFNNTIRKGVFTGYGAANAIAYSQPAMNSSLTVTLLPPEAYGQWRFPWEVAWRTNGQTARNLVAGEYPIEFRAVPGWIVISLAKPVELDNNQSASITNQYYPTISTVDTNNGGTLKVDLGPNPPSGACWGFLGSSPPWYPSDYSTNLVAGTYLIDFATVSNRVTPPNLSVQVQAGLMTYVSVNYLLAQSAPGGALLPTPVLPANISDLTDYPFGFNGQLETDVGYGSGVAVQAYVVLTAAHLVFNDQTLSYVSQAYWYFQKEAGVFAPDPLLARGSYVLSGYAAQRTNDLKVYAPDTSTPQSRNLDVAALYFLSPVAGPGGGYGGYLPSDASPNQWLTGTTLKMLVGYPVDGSQFGDATIVPGEMYQTGPQPYPLALATDPVADQQVYTATWFLSYPGNSGGPLYVQYNGYYYPAAVYLGSLYNGTTPYASAVRAIDSDVVNLITNAAASGYTGGNYAGGGVINFIPNQAINSSSPGLLQFQLAPPAAVAAGAAWRLQGDTNDNDYGTATNFTWPVLTTNAFGVQFKAIAGWNLPTNQTVTVQPGQITAYTAFYTVTNPVLVAGKSVGLGITGTTGTVYQLQRRTNLTSGSWLPVSTNTILTNGFNLLLPQPATNGNAFFYRAVWLGY